MQKTGTIHTASISYSHWSQRVLALAGLLVAGWVVVVLLGHFDGWRVLGPAGWVVALLAGAITVRARREAAQGRLELLECERRLSVVGTERRTDDIPHMQFSGSPAPEPAIPPHPVTIAQPEDLVHASRAAGLVVHTRVLGPTRPVSEAIDAAATRIVHESLTNVLHHAPGAEATVTVRYAPEYLDLAIDNTRPDPAAENTTDEYANDFEITAMNDRLRGLGGALTGGPRPSGGFRVAARLPYAAAVPR